MKSHLAIAFTTCLIFSDPSIRAATYVEPVEGKVLFRTDKLPIDVDTIHWLSSQLVIVASSQRKDTAEELRAKAQLLAISRQLDENNAAAKELNLRLKEDRNFEMSKVEDIQKAKARVWSVVRFLDGKSAGADANQLANRIKDALSVVDPKHPSLKAHQENPGAWTNVVAPIDQYRRSKELPEARVDRPVITDEPDDDTPPERPTKRDPEPKADIPAEWYATKSAIILPIDGYVEVEEKKRYFRDYSYMSFDIKPASWGEDKERPRIDISTNLEFEHEHHEKSLEKSVQSILEKQWGKFGDVKVGLKVGRREGKLKRTDFLTAGVSTVLNGVLAKKQIRSGLLVVGSIDNEGAYTKTDNFWSAAMELKDNESLSNRILVPVDSEGDFRQFIAMEKPEFFVKNELIAVKNIKDSLNYIGIEDQGNILEATQMFQEFQKVAGNRSVGPLLTNRHVRAKLESIIAIMPNHLSAKTLLLQGTGNRPTKIETLYLAYELESAIKGMDWLMKKSRDEAENMEAKKVSAITEKLDERLDQIQPFVDSADKGMMEDCRKIVYELKNLARARERDREDSAYHKKLARKSFIDSVEIYKRLDKQLASITKRKTGEEDK